MKYFSTFALLSSVLTISTSASGRFSSISGDVVETLEQELDQFLEKTILKASEKSADSSKLSVDPFEHFAPIPVDSLIRTGRSTCAGSGVGNLGFNSFNFLTFMVLTFNAIANTNNNINNNNNNDNDINLNSISQDSNNAVSNSDNMNTIMVMILPMPGKRSIEENRPKNCRKQNRTINVQNWIAMDVLDVLADLSDRSDRTCHAYDVCKSVKDVMISLKNKVCTINTRYPLDDVIGGNVFMSNLVCEDEFPECVAM